MSGPRDEQRDAIRPMTHLIRHLVIPAAIMDRSGSVLRVNDSWAEIAEGLVTHLLQVVRDNDRAAVTDCLVALARDVPPSPAVVQLVNGRWAQLQIQPADGGLWLCTVTDIHELKTRHDQLVESSRIQGRLLDSSTDCFMLLDPAGLLLFVNNAGCAALGIDPQAGFGQVWLDLLPPEVRRAGSQALALALRAEVARFTGRIPSRAGVVETWDNLLTPITDDADQVTSVMCVARNVSDAQAARAELVETKERLAMATMVGGLGIWDFDILTDGLYCDETWHRIMGRDPHDHPVTSMEEFRPMIHVDDVERATEVTKTAAALIASGEDYTITFRIVRPGGEVRWVRSAASLMQDEAGNVVRAVGFVVDITDELAGRRALEQANRALERERAVLEKQSLEDPLTGLPNRRALSDALVAASRRSRSEGTPLSVAMVDVDHFKRYNDHYGHLAGDEVLGAVAGCLRQVTRSQDFVARYGGEEFVLVLGSTADPAPALRRLQHLLAGLSLRHEGSPLGRITVSCGCVVYPARSPAQPDADSVAEVDLDPDDMLLAADLAMYQAKAAGRDRIVVTNPQ